jgi:hypothetical protein
MQRAAARQYDDARAYGIAEGAANDNAGALERADAAGATELPRGTWRVATNTTLSGNWNIKGLIDVPLGVTLTLNGDIDAPRKRIFTGAGTVLMPGQKSLTKPEWFGPVSNQATESAAGFARAIAALTNGGMLDAAGGGRGYMVEATVAWKKTVAMAGQGGGYNAEVGGTIFRPTEAFRTSGEPMFTFDCGDVVWRDIYILGPTTDDTLTYIAIRFDPGCGDMDFTNVRVNGSGIGFQLRAGNGGNFRGCIAQNCAIDGWQFGGLEGYYSGPWRIRDMKVNNASVVTATNGETTSGRVLNFASTAAMVVGQGLASVNVPIGATIVSKTATTVTISVDVTGTVPSGATVVHGHCLDAVMFRFLGNAFDIEITAEVAGGQTMVSIDGTPGLLKPNAIWFRGLNATLSTHCGVKITRGLNIDFDHSWIGGVPFGDAVTIDARDDDGEQDSTFVEGVNFNGTLIGGCGAHGINAICGTNLSVKSGAVCGHSLLASATYDNIMLGALMRGDLEIVGNNLANGPLDSVQGLARYSVNSVTGAFTGGTVMIVGNKIGGITGGINDNFAPTGDQKLIAPNVVAA